MALVDLKGMILERHRYGVPNPVQLQNAMQALTVTKDITGVEDMQISMLGPFNDATTEFTPGDMVVVRDMPSHAWSWGRVSAVRSSLRRDSDGRLTHAPYAVAVQGWFDFLSRSRVHIFETKTSNSIGTLFSMTEWQSISASLQGLYMDGAGVMLEYMMSRLLRIQLPESLGGGWLYEEVKVVHNQETAQKFAKEFEDIEPVSFGNLMPSITLPLGEKRSSDIGSILSGLFLHEPLLIEMFPYMSTGGSEPFTPLGNILGAQPVVVYRIKPFRLDPLYTAAVSKIQYEEENPEAGYLSRQPALYSAADKARLETARKRARTGTTELLLDQSLFKQQTLQRSDMSFLPPSFITSMTRQRLDSDRVNAASINAVPPEDSGGSVTIGAFEPVGLPITQDDQVQKHGLRMRVPTWPFYPPGGTNTSLDMTLFYRAVAAQIMQFYQNGHLFDNGSMTLHFTQALRATNEVTGIEPGRWFSTMLYPPGFTTVPQTIAPEYFGYITSVAHSIQRLPTGTLTAQTNVSFLRGHFAEMWDVLHGTVIPMGPMDRPTGSVQFPAPTGAVVSTGSYNPKAKLAEEAPKPAPGTYPPDVFIINGKAVAPPAGMRVKNYTAPDVFHFIGNERRVPANEIVFHESVSRTLPGTVEELRRIKKGSPKGVHLVISADGSITQHADLGATVTWHGGSPHNEYSIGIEVINPYKPSIRGDKYASTWPNIIKAFWAQGGYYVVPTQYQAEAAARLVQFLTSGAGGLNIPRTWVGYNEKTKRMGMNRIPGGGQVSPGIHAHTYWAHSDAAWVVLYSYLRLELKLIPPVAYTYAMTVASVDSRSVSLAVSNTVTPTVPAAQPTNLDPDRSTSKYGTIVQSYRNAVPLVVVFGGQRSSGRESGDYMFDYFGPILGQDAVVFVAKNAYVSARGALKWAEDNYEKRQEGPSKKVLYLFSLAWRPGRAFAPDFSEFDKVYLVDIWMGAKESFDVYIPAVRANPKKFVFIYTETGTAASEETLATMRATGVESYKLSKAHYNHFSCNNFAVTQLKNYLQRP